MCGINGITTIDETKLLVMNEQTKHRGPDAGGVFTTPGISLGHNRLSVIDLSANANQPMHSGDRRFTIVFNGEIYNYKELREELKGRWVFQTESDTEVLLAGYTLWGSEVLNRLKGIFAFAIWDALNSEVLLARDHMGVKPLYYAFKDSILYFSSELGGVIAGTGYKKLSKQALAYYISLNYVPSPYTLVEGISKLEPAQLLRYREGKWETKRYWTPKTPGIESADSNVLRAIVDTSVARQLVSDRPVGVLLSGGLDSSIVLHHTMGHMKDVRTFSVDFEMVKGAEDEAVRFNADARIAEVTATHYGATHTTFTLGVKQIQTELDNAFQSFDEPIANPTAVSRYLISKMVREKGIVVALGGDGGDELFGGYPRYRIAMGASYFQRLPVGIQKLLGHLHPQIQKLQIPYGAPMHMQLMALKADKFTGVFTQDYVGAHVREFFEARYADAHIQALDPVDQFMRVDRESWLADESLAQSDRTSMAHGLELRVPLLDLDIVEYTDSLRGIDKFKPWVNKKILRDAYRHVLPHHIFGEPKRGWISPGAKWLRDPVILAYTYEVLSSGYYHGLNSLYNWDIIKTQLKNHVDKNGYHLYPLWNIMALQVWAKRLGIEVS